MPSNCERQKSNLVSMFLLFFSLFLCVVNAQDDTCEIYNDGYICQNYPRTTDMRSSLFDDPLTCDQNLYKNVMKLLEDGQKILEAEFAMTDSEEAVLMIGNTGTGTSTLTYFLAGDNSKMFSYQKETDVFQIKDCNGKIGHGDSSLISATIYPDLVIENSTGTPFFDNPGFENTRSHCAEIANAYFMQQITNHFRKVKFVIVVNKFDVSSIGSREDFPRALRNIMSFVPNIEKFGEGLGLVATKFAALTSNDDSYVQDVVSFMDRSKSSFPEIFSNEDDLQKANFIVDSIAQVARVGVFRMPSKCGLLSEIDLMQKSRRHILKVILENIQFVESSPEDFALSISAEAQLKVQEVGVELAKKIQNSIQTFSSAIYIYFINFGCIQQNNCDNLVQDFKILFNNPDFINEYDYGDFVGLNFIDFVKRITNGVFLPPKLVDSLPKGFIDDLVQNAGHLDFMSNLATLNVDPTSWLQSLKDTKRSLKEHVGGLVSDVDQILVEILRGLSEDFQKAVNSNLKVLVNGKLGDSTPFETALVGLYESSYNLSQSVEGLDPSTYMKEINQNVHLFSQGFSDQAYLNKQLSSLLRLSLNLDWLTQSFNASSNFNPKSWVAPLISLESSVFDRIDLEQEAVTKNIGYYLSQIFIIFKGHFYQLNANGQEMFRQVLDMSKRQLTFLDAFSTSVVKGELRTTFIANLTGSCYSVNSIFVILGSQDFLSDIIRLDNALEVLESINTGTFGVIPDEWVAEVQSSIATIRQYVANFENDPAFTTTTTTTPAARQSAHEVTDSPLDKKFLLNPVKSL